MSGRIRAVAVCCKAACRRVEAGRSICNDREHERTEYAADNLRDDIWTQITNRKASCNGESDAHCGIQVRSGNMAEGVGHRQDRQAEGKRNTRKAYPRFREFRCEYGAAAPSEN